jgi:isoleucyl-tRNA synthetase
VKTAFCTPWHEFPEQPDEDDLIHRWGRIRELRSRYKALEEARSAGRIGSSLAAVVEIHAEGEDFALLDSLGDDLRLVLLTSEARVIQELDSTEEKVLVIPSTCAKCARCWHYRTDVGIDDRHSAICGRCVSNLYGPGCGVMPDSRIIRFAWKMRPSISLIIAFIVLAWILLRNVGSKQRYSADNRYR